MGNAIMMTYEQLVKATQTLGADLECYCMACGKAVTMIFDSDSYAPSTPDGDETWWTHYKCEQCREVFDASGRQMEPTEEQLLAYNKKRLAQESGEI